MKIITESNKTEIEIWQIYDLYSEHAPENVVRLCVRSREPGRGHRSVKHIYVQVLAEYDCQSIALFLRNRGRRI